jgi:steroid delta-isomerase-like uncharacterized protein
MTGKIEHVIQELIEACNTHDIERAADCFTSDSLGYDVAEAKPLVGRDSVRQYIARYLAAFPDLTWFQEEVISQRDSVAIIWLARGTHQGTWVNIPPTGRIAQVRGMTRFKIEDGKIARTMTIWDVAGLLRAIGLLPQLRR